MYSVPPAGVVVAGATNAVVNTLTTTTILVAPGATRRIRLYGVYFYLLQNEPAANVFRLNVLGPGGTVAFPCILQVGAVASDGVFFPAPGIQLTANGALVCESRCTAVNRTFIVSVHYYVDTIS